MELSQDAPATPAAEKPLAEEIRDVLAKLRPTDHVNVEKRCVDGIMQLLMDRGHYLPGAPPAQQILARRLSGGQEPRPCRAPDAVARPPARSGAPADRVGLPADADQARVRGSRPAQPDRAMRKAVGEHRFPEPLKPWKPDVCEEPGCTARHPTLSRNGMIGPWRCAEHDRTALRTRDGGDDNG
jgi:hypothetical protein